MSFNEKKCFFSDLKNVGFLLLKTAFSVFLKPIPFILQHNETLVGFKPILIFFCKKKKKKKGELQRFSRSLSLRLSNTSWNITFQRRRKLNGGFRIWLFSAKMFFSLFSFFGSKRKDDKSIFTAEWARQSWN